MSENLNERTKNNNDKAPNLFKRILNKAKLRFKGQGMPKYQNLYLSERKGELKVTNGGGIVTVLNCYYDPSLASYVYWCQAGGLNGVKVVIPEKNLELVTKS